MFKPLRRGAQGAFLVSLFMILGGIFSLARTGEAAPVKVRVLTASESGATFGDNAVKCHKNYACTTGFTDAPGKCAKCQSVNNREVCCSFGTKDDCAYTGGGACTNSDRYIGDISGSAGTCNTCTSLAYTKQTVGCTSVVNGAGTACPS
jgi:hypothetical protein